MTRIRLGRIAATGLAVALTLAAATCVRADFKSLDKRAHQDHRIPLTLSAPNAAHAGAANQAHAGTNSKSPAPGSRPAKVTITNQGHTHVAVNYLLEAQSLHKAKAKTVPAHRFATNDQSGSTITTVGNAPAGFGKIFNWDRKQPSCLLVVFVNSADMLGVCINNMQAGDTIEVSSATGMASFSKDTGNPLISSIIGLIGEGATAAVDGLTGSTQFNQAISDAASFAQSQFKGTGDPEKFRDAFGVDHNTGGHALAEGGVLVCLPQAGGTYYSSDDRSGWATDAPKGQARGLPSYLQQSSTSNSAFFLGQNVHNSGVCTTNGQAYILAWDFAYADNAGTYQLFVKLTQGSSSSQPPGGGVLARGARRR